MIRLAATYLPAILLPRVGAFITILAGANLLAPEQFGYLSLTTLIGELADMTMTNWTRVAMARFGSKQSGLSRQFAMRMVLIAAACTVGAVAVSAFTVVLVTPDAAATLLPAVLAYVVAVSTLRIGLTLHQAMDSRLFATMIESGRALTSLAATVGAMVITRDFLVASLAGSLTSLAAGILAVCTGMARTRRQASHVLPAGTILRFGAPLLPLALLSQLLSGADKLLLAVFHDAATVAFYAAAFVIGKSAFDIVGGAFNIGGFVRLSSMFNSGQRNQAQVYLGNQLSLILSVSLPIGGFIIGTRHFIGPALLPPAYLDAYLQSVPLVSVGAILLVVKHFVYDNVFHLTLRNFRQLPTVMTGVVVSLAIGVVLVPLWPAFGAAVMFAAGGASSLVASIVLSSSLLRIDVNWKSVTMSAAVAVVVCLMVSVVGETMRGTPSILMLLVLSVIGAAGSLISLWHANRYLPRVVDPSLQRRTSVLHVATSFKNGGTESLLCSILEHGGDWGDIDQYVLILNDFVDDEILERLSQTGTSVVRINRPPSSRNPKYLLKTASAVSDIDPQVIHCHSSHALYWILLATALAPARRVFRSLHGADIVPRFRWYDRLVHRHFVHRVIAVSGAILSQCVARGLNNATLVHNGIDLSRYHPAPSLRNAVGLTVICVGRLSIDVKGHDVLVEAIGLCRARGAEINAVIVGAEADTEIGVGAELRSKAREWEVAEQIRFLGHRTDVPQLFSEADVFVLPSRQEGFGLALVEGMAAGLPAVASDIDGPREILRNGEDGILFAAGDSLALAEALLKLHSDQNLRQRLSAAARARAETFSIITTASLYRSLYDTARCATGRLEAAAATS